VEAPGGTELTWLLYYLARTDISVKQEDISQKLESLVLKLGGNNEADDPGDFLYSLLRYTSVVRRGNTAKVI
jgi:hypothetical protein